MLVIGRPAEGRRPVRSFVFPNRRTHLEFQEEDGKKRTARMEAVAENDEELLNKYLESGELSEEELKRGVARGIAAGALSPVFIGSAYNATAMDAFLDAVVENFPSPADMPAVKAKRKDGSEVELPADPNGVLLARIFKTTSDPGIGDIFYFRVYSGTIKSGDDVYNSTESLSERIGHLLQCPGCNLLEVQLNFAAGTF